MADKSEVKIIRGPIVPLKETESGPEYPMLYSVHLENGWVATSPDAYPDTVVEQPEQIPQDDQTPRNGR